MHSPSPDSDSKDQGSSAAGSDGPERAAVAPTPKPVTESPVPAGFGDSPAEAEGRRTLSTAFVRMGPDGHLTVELRNGQVLLLRNVVMRRRDYCGVQVLGGRPGRQYCGGYGDVAAARPGGVPAPE